MTEQEGNLPPADPAARRRPWWQRRIVTVPVLLLVLLAVAEGGIRVGAFLLRRDDPMLSHASGGGRVIYCIGDSFTYGTGVEREQAWPALLEKRLNQESRTKRADVNNLGFPGLSTANAYFAVARAIEQGDAAVIFVMAGWNANDSDFAGHARDRNEAVPLVARVENLFERLRIYKLAKQILTRRSRAAVLDEIELVPQTTMELYQFRAYQEIAYRNLKKIARLCREFGVPLVLLNYPYRDLPPNEFTRNEYYHLVYGRTPIDPSDYIIRDRGPDEIAIHSVIRKVGEEEGVRVVDFQKAFVDSGQRGIFQRDWHHPTARGHRIMAAAIYDDLGEDLVRLVDAMSGGGG